MKKLFPKIALAATIAVASSTSFATQTLRLAHFWPATSAVNTEIFSAWASTIEDQSNGQLKIEIYPSQTLVKAAKLYDGAVSGLADISGVVQGYSAGRFPLSEITQLPGITTSSSQGSCILQNLYDSGAIAHEYDDSHVLFMFSTGPAYLHTRNKEVKVPEDLAGLRMRRPTEVAGMMLAEMGAAPIGMPAPGIYEALDRGVVDGLSFPFEAMKVFRINELTKHHVKIPYGSSIFVATMNKRTYNNLSPELKNIIDNNSGMDWALSAGKVFDRLDQEGLAEAKAQGDSIHVVNDPLNDPDWGVPLRKGTEKYLNSIEQRGAKTAREVYQAASKLSRECNV